MNAGESNVFNVSSVDYGDSTTQWHLFIEADGQRCATHQWILYKHYLNSNRYAEANRTNWLYAFL